MSDVISFVVFGQELVVSNRHAIVPPLTRPEQTYIDRHLLIDGAVNSWTV